MSNVEPPIPQPSRPAGAGYEPLRRSPLALACAAVICGLGVSAVGVTLVRAADDAGIFDVMQNDYVHRAVRAVRLKDRPARSARGADTAGGGFEIRPPTLADAEPAAVDLPPRAASRIPPRAAQRYASEPAPDARPAATTVVRTAAKTADRPAGKSVERKARVAMSTVGQVVAARRTVCVRVCDGYAFPLGNVGGLGDLPIHQAGCSSACPGAQTALYTLAPGQRADDTALARSVDTGAAYRRLPTAFLFKKERIAACSCQGPDNVAQRLPILLDPTLRAGDVFVDKKGTAKVFAGGGRVPHSPRAFADVRASPALSRQAQADVDRVMGVLQREARARAFEKTLAVREAAAKQAAARRGAEPAARVREAHLREVTAPAGSAANVRVYHVTMDGARADASGARIVEVR